MLKRNILYLSDLSRVSQPGVSNNPFVANFKEQPPQQLGGDLTKNPFCSSFIPPPGKLLFSPILVQKRSKNGPEPYP